MNFFLNNIFTICDAPRAWGVYFQDSASPQMEALVELHDNIMFYLVIILFGVGWILVSVIRNYVYNKSPISNKYLNHGTLIELIWTITPALILILIAFPTFKLLYLMDEVTDPSLTVFVEGHQWYWSYQYPDFLNEEDEELEFGSYLVPVSDLDYINLNSDEAPSPQPEESSDLFDQEVADGEESSEDGECRHVFLPGEYEIYDEDNPSENFGDTCENCNYPYDDEDSVSKCSKCNEWFHSNCYETDWGHIEAESGGPEEAESGGPEEAESGGSEEE